MKTAALPSVIAALLISTSPAVAGNWFIAGGYSLHDESKDCPEVCFGSNHLVYEKLGYTWEPDKAIEVDIYSMHMSSPFVVESGHGYNPYFNAELRYKF